MPAWIMAGAAIAGALKGGEGGAPMAPISMSTGGNNVTSGRTDTGGVDWVGLAIPAALAFAAVASVYLIVRR